MISQTAEYALRAIVSLADNDGGPMTTNQLAGQTRVPPGYLAKVMQSLVKGGLVTSQRGPSGGFTLVHTLEETTVLDVINAVDPIPRIEVCPLGLPSHGTELCSLHRRLDQAMAEVERTFRSTTIRALLEAPGPSRPLKE